MGGCVTTHQKPSAMKVEALFGSTDIKPPIINGDLAVKPQSFRNFGSKEETFFDSQAWLDSDCDDDFMSVNGGKKHFFRNFSLWLMSGLPLSGGIFAEFTPSRGNTPVHHNFSAGNNKPPLSTPYQPSPSSSEKKMRLSDLFKDSLRGNYDSEGEQDDDEPMNNGVGLKAESPFMHGGEVGANGLKTKRERFGSCFPSLLSSRSSSTNGRKMMSPSPRPNAVVG